MVKTNEIEKNHKQMMDELIKETQSNQKFYDVRKILFANF